LSITVVYNKVLAYNLRVLLLYAISNFFNKLAKILSFLFWVLQDKYKT